jgi:hypothetical protein
MYKGFKENIKGDLRGAATELNATLTKTFPPFRWGSPLEGKMIIL